MILRGVCIIIMHDNSYSARIQTKAISLLKLKVAFITKLTVFLYWQEKNNFSYTWKCYTDKDRKICTIASWNSRKLKASLIRMSCKILEIIWNKWDWRTNSNIKTCLSLSFLFPFSSLRFLLSLNKETLRKFDRNLSFRSVCSWGEKLFLSRIRAQESAVSETLDSLIPTKEY